MPKETKKPLDINQLAKSIVDAATGDSKDGKNQPNKPKETSSAKKKK